MCDFSFSQVTYTPELIPLPVNNTLLPIFSSRPSETLYSTHPPITTSYKNHTSHHFTQKPLTPARPLTLRKNQAAARNSGRPDFHSKDLEHVTHLQMMLVTPAMTRAYTARIRTVWTGPSASSQKRQ